ncbi:DUF1573 domain-containing protein [Mucilaginibacter sp. UYCu711]|uniref:DUF1573 domain-containing protein n=1 Tax=Mucilaginibacter sp. UYCu711 TaxID=3156339 RepID=UPI003D243F9A
MKKLLVLSSVIIIALITVIMFYKNKLYGNGYGNYNASEIETFFFSHIDEIKIPIENNLVLRDTSGNEVPISKLTDKYRLGIYMDTHSCDLCAKEAIKFASDLIGKDKDVQPPFVLVDRGFANPRQLKLYNRGLPIQIFLVDAKESKSMTALADLHKPFYFLLDSNSKISSIFFTEEKINMALREKYFANIHHKIISNDIGKGFTITPQVQDIGNVPLRKKQKVIFVLNNNTPNNCWVTDIKTFCGCVSINKKFPYNIAPKVTDTITAYVIVTNKGDFSHPVLIFTNLKKEPYELKINGTVSDEKLSSKKL